MGTESESSVELSAFKTKHMNVNSAYSRTHSLYRSAMSGIQLHKQQEYSPVAVMDLESEEVYEESVPSVSPIDTSNSGSRWWCPSPVCISWIALVVAVLGIAIVGPVFKYMVSVGISPALATSWRGQCMVMALAPLMILERVLQPHLVATTVWWSKCEDLPFRPVVHVMINGFFWAWNLLLWIFGLRYISATKASIISCAHPLMLVLYLRCRGHRICYLEWAGVMLALAGITITTAVRQLYSKEINSEDMSSGSSSYDEFIGVALCLLAATGEVVIILNRHSVMKYVPLMQYTWMVTIVVTTLTSLTALILEGASIVGVCDTCLFGWLSDQWNVYVPLFGSIVGIAGITGFNVAGKHLPPVVMSSSQLLDPPLTGLIAWVLGVDAFPDIFTFIGGGVVLGGLALTTLGETQRKKQEEKEEAEEKQRAAEVCEKKHFEEGISAEESDVLVPVPPPVAAV